MDEKSWGDVARTTNMPWINKYILSEGCVLIMSCNELNDGPETSMGGPARCVIVTKKHKC